MTLSTSAGPVLVAFGEPQNDLWGLAISGPDPRLTVGSVSAGPVGSEVASFDSAEPSQDWVVASRSHALTVSTAIASAVVPEGAVGSGDLQLCRVSGQLNLADGPREIADAGIRCAALPTGRFDSVRLVAAWFPDDHAVALMATRPRGAAGQDRDAVVVATLGETAGLAVFDPRLSTTYGADGTPRRVGIELWLGETEDGDQFPRRVAGEVTGASIQGDGGGLRWEAHALRSHRRGESGAGVYLVIRPA